MPEYFLILVLLFLLVFSVHRYFHLKLYKNTKQMIFSYLALLIIGTVWDQFAIYRGHWSFGEKFLLGPRIGYMPIEEFGFMLVGQYLIMVIYRLTEKFQATLFPFSSPRCKI